MNKNKNTYPLNVLNDHWVELRVKELKKNKVNLKTEKKKYIYPDVTIFTAERIDKKILFNIVLEIIMFNYTLLNIKNKKTQQTITNEHKQIRTIKQDERP